MRMTNTLLDTNEKYKGKKKVEVENEDDECSFRQKCKYVNQNTFKDR